MGLFSSKSSSSSSTTNVTETVTAGAQDEGIAAAGGSSININVVDPGAVTLAGDVASDTIEAAGANLRSSLDFGEVSLVSSLDFARDVVDLAGKQSADALKIYSEKAQEDLQAAVTLSKGQTQQVTENITKWSLTIVGVLAAAGVLMFVFNPGANRGHA